LFLGSHRVKKYIEKKKLKLITKVTNNKTKMNGICEMLLWIQWIGIGLTAVGGRKKEMRETKKEKG